MTPKIVSTETIYEGWSKFSRVMIQTTGKPFKREIEDHGRAVVVLPYDPERRVAILVRLLRAPVLVAAGESSLLEAPAGLIDKEDPADAARREVMEEAGIRVTELEHIATVWTMPGISTERMDYYLAPFSQADRIAKGGGVAGENEDITVEEHPLADLWSWVRSSKLPDLKTLALVFALKDRHPELFD
ncbi:MAG: NUDIX hydrolase [Methylobacteriaceae bacterium]|nr:NUDIX hydrolase [Methylobacteriaceae bacterium]